jgi:hypothetical protein
MWLQIWRNILNWNRVRLFFVLQTCRARQEALAKASTDQVCGAEQLDGLCPTSQGTLVQTEHEA